MGAGALTFGLLCPVVTDTGVLPIVASRITGSRYEARLRRIQTRRSVAVKTIEGGTATEIPLDVLDLGADSELRRLAQLVSTPDVNLIITAARTGFDPVAEFLVSAAARRSAPLLVVSADNTPPRSWETLRAQAAVHLDTAPSIADRLCIRFPETDPDIDVLVGEHAQWVVQKDPHGICELRLQGSGVVTLVDDLEPWRRRKLFCVNGLQLALALNAFVEGYPEFDRWIRENLAEAEMVANAFAQAFAGSADENVDDARDLCMSTVERFARFPDRTGRMLGLKEGQNAGDPDDLSARVRQRLVPLREFDQSGRIGTAIAHAQEIARNWYDMRGGAERA